MVYFSMPQPMPERTCDICGRKRPLQEFPIQTTVRYPVRRCSSCKRNGWLPPGFLEPRRRRRIYWPISQAERQDLIEALGDVCGICGERVLDRHLHVDHDHKNQRVRGILCRSCNFGLGLFRDSPERLQAAISYLERPPAYEYIYENYEIDDHKREHVY